ncbi:translocation/assembly module TamB domain-containing protein [Marichromatium bheemlicum]|uniref:Translocation/assembly module TamB n=1 Tax=Marichromatium bheemlicum TaxID=365339 RepID=A0ABX1IBZ4_9GAMM|nr:translocation/assembly module TamB domain-containing protein [Marichromatium bheemlicum]NKN33705.1 translocation/assembly module TamB [Marichromatium bheemlicum]
MNDAAPPAPPAEPSTPPAPRPRRWPRRLLLVLLTLLLALVLLLGWLLGTQRGLHALLALGERLAPGVVQVERAAGRVLGSLDLTGLALRLEGISLDVDHARLDWAPGALLRGRLRVRTLTVAGVDLVLAPSPEEPDPAPLTLPDLSLPLAVEVDSLTLERLRLRAPETAPWLVLERAELGAALTRGALTLEVLEVELSEPRAALSAAGGATLSGDYPLDLALDWHLGLEPAIALRGEGFARGDLARLTLEQRLSGTVEAVLAADLEHLLEAPRWSATLELAGVRLADIQPDAPAVELTASLRSAGDLDRATLDGQLDARAPELPDFGHLALRLDGDWLAPALELRALELTEQVSGARLAANGRVVLDPAPPALQLEADWSRLRWPLSGAALVRAPEGSLRLDGTLEDFAYRLAAAIEGESFPALELRASGQGSSTQVALDSLRLETLDGTISGEGELAWVPALRWRLALDGEGLDPGQWIDGLDDRVALSLASAGDLAAFDYLLEASTQGPGLPVLALHGEGTGSAERVALEQLTLDGLDGQVSGEAEVRLAPETTWRGTVRVAGIDPGVLAPAWRGRLDGAIDLDGGLDADGLRLDARLDRIAGTLRGYPVALAGRLALAGEALRIDGLRLDSGPTRASLAGTLARDQLALDLGFDSPDLGSLLPEARGQLRVSGRLGGSAADPRLRLRALARDVLVAGQGVARLELDGALGLDPAAPLEIRLDARDLSLGGAWSRLTLTGSGTTAAHRLAAELAGEPLDARLGLAGGLDAEGRYDGRLAALRVAGEALGDWSLTRPAPLRLALPEGGVGPLCLRERGGSGGCLDAALHETGWEAGIDGLRLDLGLLEQALGGTLDLVGTLAVDGRLRAESTVLDGGLVARVEGGRLRTLMTRGEEALVEFSGSELRLEAGPGALAARLELPLTGLGTIAGEVRLSDWRLDAPARPDQSLGGELRVDLDDFSRVPDLLPDIAAMRGTLRGRLALAGTLGAPGVAGTVRLAGVGFEVPLVGLEVDDLGLTLEASSRDRFTLTGTARLGDGLLEIDGGAGLDGAAFDGWMTLAGERLRVADTAEYFALVSPELRLEAGTSGARLRGEIRVPEARIRPRSVPAGTVSPSGDVVLDGSEAGSPYPLDIDLRLVLGDEVTLDAFGVNGRLAGALGVSQRPGRDMLGDGQLQIIDGQYRFSAGFGLGAELGVPLTIEQGRLIYAKSAIANPGLLLQAQREGGDTSAGVRVLGTLREPRLAFFSDTDPEMSQSEIIKYLVTGIAPQDNDQINDTGLAVGTYVAPKVYMEYESGLGDEPNKVRLRYDLSRRIELQTETGESQGADIFFKFEN